MNRWSALEIRGIVKSEVAIHHRNHHLVAQGRLAAIPARLDLATLGAAVAVEVVAVVTLLRRNDDAITAFRGA